MFRLKSNLLQPVPEMFCDSSSHFTITLLNVRSIQWNLYNAATVGPEKSDLIIEVAELF